MFFFRGKKKEQDLARKDAELKAIQKDIQKSVDKAAASAEKLNKLLEDKDAGITGMIFYATGGSKRDDR